MRTRTIVAAAVLGLLTLTAGCSGADSILDPQTSPGGGSPPSTVDAGNENLGDGGSAGHLGAK
jgi:hypothetical protein